MVVDDTQRCELERARQSRQKHRARDTLRRQRKLRRQIVVTAATGIEDKIAVACRAELHVGAARCPQNSVWTAEWERKGRIENGT